MMNDHEDHFTVFIRLPFPRGDFVDPPPVAWSASKERDLWELLSRQSKGNEIDWGALADKFQVTQSFLLQQAAWLYERQLSQVRAQMRKMGNRSSNTASPAPGSAIGSVVGAQPMKRTGSGGSRVPSRLSTQTTPVIPQEGSVPNTPVRSRTSLPFRPGPSSGQTHSRVGSTTSRPLSRQSSKDAELPSRTHSRRGSVQHQTSRSPIRTDIPKADSSSEEEPVQMGQSRLLHRRPNPSAALRRNAPTRKTQHARRPSAAEVQLEEEDEEDTPAFLPFSGRSTDAQQTSHDPSATLKGSPSQTKRPPVNRRATSERISAQTTQQARAQLAKDTLTSSESDALESPRLVSNLAAIQNRQHQAAHGHRSPSGRGALPNPLSPHQQAALAQAAGLSPRRRSTNPQQQAGSDTSPSMGSSFSDLDDASVTQSALEEALLSGMGNTTMTIGGVGGGVASRVSGISQALRSKYFDARASGPGNGESQR